MAKQYFGVAALTVVRQKSTGSRMYVYAGQPIGDDVAAEELHRLESEGFIEAIEVPDPVPHTGADEAGNAGELVAPAATAKKADWVDYAVAKGYDRDEAEKATQAELIKALG